MKKRLAAAIVVLVIIVVAALAVRSQFRHIAPQPAWMSENPQTKYFYASVDPDKTQGIPYWVWLAMPRMFPEHMPGPGGYAALGMAWEEGREMPIGFAKARVGYIRVSGNCALCHVMTQPTEPGQSPRILNAVEGKTTDITPLLTFLRECAADPRFNADEFFSETNTDTKLSTWDKLLYRYVLIPRVRKAFATDPSAVLLSPALRAHWKNPQSDAPFADPEMRVLRQYVQTQVRPAPAPNQVSMSAPPPCGSGCGTN
jgi:hypothetical protein